MFLIRRDYYKEKQKIWEYNVIDLYPITALKSDLFMNCIFIYWISVLVPSGWYWYTFPSSSSFVFLCEPSQNG